MVQILILKATQCFGGAIVANLSRVEQKKKKIDVVRHK